MTHFWELQRCLCSGTGALMKYPEGSNNAKGAVKSNENSPKTQRNKSVTENKFSNPSGSAKRGIQESNCCF